MHFIEYDEKMLMIVYKLWLLWNFHCYWLHGNEDFQKNFFRDKTDVKSKLTENGL